MRTVIRIIAGLSAGLCLSTAVVQARHSAWPARVAPAPAAAGDVNIRHSIQANHRFRTSVTNWGYQGSLSGNLLDSAHTDSNGAFLPAPGFESPSFSGIDYLFSAGLWIGGIVDGDTLVSVGSFGWGQAHEIYPSIAGQPTLSDLRGDVEYTVVYADSLTDPQIVARDSLDGAHQPLPIRVRQTTRLVEDSLYANGLIVELTVTNIGERPISGLAVGWLTDCDIGHQDQSQVWLHDISGFRQSTATLDGQNYEIAAAWSADIDGKPDPDSLVFTDQSPTQAFASMYLGGAPRMNDVSFNWWVPAFSGLDRDSLFVDRDWGPQRAPGIQNFKNGLGTPLGDGMKYRFMTNGEIDYPQIYSAVDLTAEGWIAPPPEDIANQYADGWDTRFLHTVGTATLAPGDSLTVAWAWAVIPDWHSDPSHFDETFDALAPQAYLDGLGMSGLDPVMARMQELWDTDYARATIDAPRQVTIAGWDDHAATLQWQPRGTARLSAYHVLRSFDPLMQNSVQQVAALLPSEPSFTDLNLTRDSTYYYTVVSVDASGRRGRLAPIVDVLPDRPMAPAGLRAVRGDAAIALTWTPPAEPDVLSHRVYRRLADSPWNLLSETAARDSFTDATAENAVVYEYQIGAVSALGNESFLSEAIVGLAFAFDSLPLVLDHTPSDPSSLTDKDSVRQVWTTLFGTGAATYDDADPDLVAPFGLGTYNNHPALLVASEGRFAIRPDAEQQIALYLYTGGVAVLSGRDLFNYEPITEGTIAYSPGDFPYDDFGVTAAFYPRVLLAAPTRMNAEFVAARAVRPGWPDLMVDPTRADWGINPALPSTEGAIPFVGYVDVDTARAEVLYTFESRDPFSPLNGKPVGIISRNPERRSALFTFPLSSIAAQPARDVLIRILRESGWTSRRAGDVTGDGQVDILDVVAVIDHLYHGRTLPLTENASVGGIACDVDLVDAIILLTFTQHGDLALVHQCR